MNIKDLISGQIGGVATSLISKKLNIDEGKAKWLIAAAVPLMIAAISYNSKNKNKEASINKALEKHSGGILGNLTNAFTGDNSNDGDKIVGHIFGKNKDYVTQNLSENSGLSSDQVSSTLAILAPIVMGFLGKEKQSQASSGGVGDLLGSLLSGGQAQKSSGGMLGGLLGSVLGGNNKKQASPKGGGGLGPIGDLAGEFFNQKNNSGSKGNVLGTLVGMFGK